MVTDSPIIGNMAIAGTGGAGVQPDAFGAAGGSGGNGGLAAGGGIASENYNFTFTSTTLNGAPVTGNIAKGGAGGIGGPGGGPGGVAGNGGTATGGGIFFNNIDGGALDLQLPR